MNLWIVLTFSFILMQSFESTNRLSATHNGKLIKRELDQLTNTFKNSNYWKSKYQTDLRLYTAKIDDYADACTQPIFDCYCEEFEVVAEEISMTGEEDVAKDLRNTLANMRTYRPSKSDMTGSCKKCEEYEEKPFQEFLKSFESITQKMNT
ncbi:interleukin-15 isoform 1-T3 [Leptodactylus fuscus]|uniref:interleukin-15 n=1 Tax=Leptodactylus fuscus TaxID=238119 RepID=UPI003F4E4D9E